ncbi:hypothetical protein DM01DRAFT_1333522 [Hesseltinella vesiculosa]|uniref:Alginate lyase domain-containing protein n=1 Tax=Hesseltinella vesiculosa TaxID=101127 RepID=A0A1X2GQ30_9FUNG|nr:hypothetical protein DM01DRAFT_1333522 [Hesseltinella vesiculosa]
MAEQVFYLCLGYLVFGTPAYAQHATHLLQVFFLDEATRMNPNVNYGQVIRGTTNPSGIGRAEGIMSTRVLAQVANVVPALEGDAGYQVIADPLKQWFQSYVDWLILSDMGKKEYASKNNHCTWYLVQVVTIGMTFGNSACQEKVRSMLASFLGRQVPHHIDSETGDQPLESARTRPYHYLVFNLQALLYLTDWARCHPVRPPWPLQEPLMKLAVDHLVDYDVTYTKEDMTEAVPLLRTMQARLAKHHAPYHAFYEKACQSDSAEKISGPKHQICYLWS